jgi:gliding motility-associated lipoprotein GldH
LYLFLQTRFPNGNVSRDTLEIVLANAEGKWLGKGWGDIREDHVLLRKQLRFPLGGTYAFSVWQAMRQDTLKGIQDIGIQIVPAGK